MISCLRTGTAAGLLVALLSYGPFFIPGQAVAWAGFAEIASIAAAALCLAPMWRDMRRRRAQHGRLPFGRGVAVGFGTTCVAASVAAAGAWLAYAIGGETVPSAIHAAYALQVLGGGRSGTAIDADLAELAAMRPLLFDPRVQAVALAVTVLAIGALESVLGAWALRPRAPRARPG